MTHAPLIQPPAASKPPALKAPPPAWPALGLDGGDLIDAAAILAAVAAAAPPARRKTAVAALRAAQKAARARLATAIAAAPHAAWEAVRAYSHLADTLVATAAEVAWTHLHPRGAPTRGERVAIVLVGGCGRGEMAPHSDIDLLFLTPYKRTPWSESVIESILYMLWELKLKLGHSVRTVAECLRQARGDLTIRTALLEHRHLVGDAALTEELTERLWSELFNKTGPEFVEGKLDEREQRHTRMGGSRYLVEPNVKESKGGLRDLQTLYWIAKYVNRATSVEELLARDVFTPGEVEIFRAAEAFLWATRIQLHLLTRRSVDTLTFDAQVEVAEALGFEDRPGQRGVERFMQTYFTHARHVGELTRIFLVSLEAQHVKRRPSIGRALRRTFSFGADRLGEAYTVVHGRIDLTDPDSLIRDPVNMLRYVEEAMRTGLLMHPNGLRQIATNIDLIDDRLRRDGAATAILLRLLHHPTDPVRALRRMNELGLLGAFIPEFGRIVAMMQYNMYHHYTVDEHTLQCIAQLHDLEQGKLKQQLPIASEIVDRGFNRRVLYVALLLHDVGKGQTEDHAIVGARVARDVCQRLGLPLEEAETVIWLVRNHLMMSDTAQKRDLSDARTLRDFADLVGSPTRLKLLHILTVCDIRGVGPGVWNNWKAALLRALYHATRGLLTGGGAPLSTDERVAEAKTAFAAALPDWSAEEVEAELSRHYDAFWIGLDLATQMTLAEIRGAARDDTPAIRIDPDPARDATRAVFAMPDHPGLFSRIAGALALAGANVVDARSYTTSDGMATDVFWIQDREGRPYETARLDRLRQTIARTLAGEVVVRDAVAVKDRLKRREREFLVPTEIHFDNDGSDLFTVIEVTTRDRPGLLHDLTRTLTEAGVTISSAIVATYGEEAIDSFYVKDIFGLKIRSGTKQVQLREKLEAAIAHGAQRAEA